MSMFHVGQIVACVNGAETCGGLETGNIYTVTGLGTDEYPDGEFLQVDAWQRGSNYWFRRRFRPVHTTGISIFEAMLVPTPKEKVEA